MMIRRVTEAAIDVSRVTMMAHSELSELTLEYISKMVVQTLNNSKKDGLTSKEVTARAKARLSQPPSDLIINGLMDQYEEVLDRLGKAEIDERFPGARKRLLFSVWFMPESHASSRADFQLGIGINFYLGRLRDHISTLVQGLLQSEFMILLGNESPELEEMKDQTLQGLLGLFVPVFAHELDHGIAKYTEAESLRSRGQDELGRGAWSMISKRQWDPELKRSVSSKRWMQNTRDTESYLGQPLELQGWASTAAAEIIGTLIVGGELDQDALAKVLANPAPVILDNPTTQIAARHIKKYPKVWKRYLRYLIEKLRAYQSLNEGMGVVRFGSSHKEREGASSFYDYRSSLPKLSTGVSLINGRYPKDGSAVDQKVDATYYVESGTGWIYLNGMARNLSKWDLVTVPKGTNFWIRGTNLRLVVSSSPTWYPGQHQLREAILKGEMSFGFELEGIFERTAVHREPGKPLPPPSPKSGKELVKDFIRKFYEGGIVADDGSIKTDSGTTFEFF